MNTNPIYYIFPINFFFLTQNRETQKHQSHLKVHRTPKLWWLRDSRKSHRLRKGRELYAVSILITLECTQSVLTSFLSVSWISCCLLDFETHSLSTAPSLSKLLNVSVGKRHHYLRYSKTEILSFSTFFHLLVSFFYEIDQCLSLFLLSNFHQHCLFIISYLLHNYSLLNNLHFPSLVLPSPCLSNYSSTNTSRLRLLPSRKTFRRLVNLKISHDHPI